MMEQLSGTCSAIFQGFFFFFLMERKKEEEEEERKGEKKKGRKKRKKGKRRKKEKRNGKKERKKQEDMFVKETLPFLWLSTFLSVESVMNFTTSYVFHKGKINWALL